MPTKLLKSIDVERQMQDKDDPIQPNYLESGRQSIVNWFRDTSSMIPLASRKTKNKLDDSATALRHKAVDNLFGLSATHIADWDGLLVFIYHLESCYNELLDPSFEFIWNLLGRSTPSTAVDVWHWCFAVVNTYQSLKDHDPSIDRIYQQIWKTARDDIYLGRAMCNPTEDDKNYTLQAIFAILCWTSATLKPILGKRTVDRPQLTSDQDISNEEATSCLGSITFLAENCSRVYSSIDSPANSRRPTSKMFHSYRLRTGSDDDHEPESSAYLSIGVFSQAPGYYQEDMLYESSLNYASLFSIGCIRIRLVDTLTAHLAFDSTVRELSVYRYPSFCVAKIIAGRKIKILESITEKLLPPRYHVDNPNKEPDSVYREILLSYRLLFGQSQKSRKILGQIFDHMQNGSGTNRVQLVGITPGEDLDPYLKTLCTSRLHSGWVLLGVRFGGKQNPHMRGDLFPSSVLNTLGQLSESDYSARDNFPILGLRLLALQRYNMRRQPNKILDLWRDRRNPLQWYTFWVVLLVGGAGILLAVFQLVVSIIQTIYAVNPVT